MVIVGVVLGLLVFTYPTIIKAAPPPSCAGKHVIGPADPISATFTPSNASTIEVCLGSSVSFSVSATDYDEYDDPQTCQATTTKSWTDSEGGSGGGSSYTFTPTSAGTKTVTCTTSDPTGAGNDPDPDPSSTWTVLVKDLTSISGPTTVHRGENATFTAGGTFGSDTNQITWGGGDDPASGTSVSYTTKWNTGGLKTVTVSYCGKSKSLDVLVLVPCGHRCCNTNPNPLLNPTCGVWYDPRLGCPCTACRPRWGSGL
jgi:hypothetical protein